MIIYHKNEKSFLSYALVESELAIELLSPLNVDINNPLFSGPPLTVIKELVVEKYGIGIGTSLIRSLIEKVKLENLRFIYVKATAGHRSLDELISFSSQFNAKVLKKDSSVVHLLVDINTIIDVKTVLAAGSGDFVTKRACEQLNWLEQTVLIEDLVFIDCFGNEWSAETPLWTEGVDFDPNIETYDSDKYHIISQQSTDTLTPEDYEYLEAWRDEHIARGYSQLMTTPPPIIVEHQRANLFIIWDGRHRVRARFLQGGKEITAYVGYQ